MTRKRSSPMGLEIYLPVLLAFIMLPLLAQAAPLQDYTEIQQYTEGCYYNYNHYNEGDRIMTNEPCLNCTCHNKMLMCYLRVCPFTKPIGHDCIVEKREDQCCPIITCPEVPVDVAHIAPAPGTELSFPEKFGCSIDGKFYLEGAQVPSNPNKPCELCYCIKNRTSCLMQECTLHIDGCTPIYNKGSCCPVRYNCDHENDVLELEDHSTTTEATTTTTTERPTTGFILTSTMSPSVSTDCVHNGELYADGARIAGETACENCYCMRGDIICAVQECHMPMLNDNGKSCHALPAAEGECCPSNYVCEDDTATTQIIEATTLPYGSLDENEKITTAAPVKDLHSAIPEEDLQLQTHIDEEETATKVPSTEGESEEKEDATEAGIIGKPTDQPITATEDHKKQDDTEQESVTKVSDEAEATTVSSTDVKPIEGEEFVTTAPISADELPDHQITTTEDQEKHEGVEEESVTKVSDETEATTVSSTYVKPTEGDESVTTAPTSADELPESSTELSVGAEDESKTESSEEIVTKSPTQEEEEEHAGEEAVTKVPIAADEISTDATASGEEYATETSEEGKPEHEESVTKIPAVDAVESQSSTEVTPSEEVSEESTESSDKVKPVAGEELVTMVPTLGDEGISTESVTEAGEKIVTEATIAGEEEHKPVDTDDSATKAPLDMEHATETIEEAATKTPFAVGQQHDEFATEAPVQSSEDQSTEISGEEADEVSTKAPTAEEETLSIASKPEEQESHITEEEGVATTPAPGKDIIEDEQLSTEEPKKDVKPEEEEKEQQEAVTMLPTTGQEPAEETKPHGEEESSSETSVESEEAEMVTKLPVTSDEGQLSATTAPEVEEEKDDKEPTQAPVDIGSASTEEEIESSTEVSEEASGEGKPIATDEEQIDITTAPTKSEEDHTTIPSAEDKPVLADELGSGDHTDEELSEAVVPTTEAVTSIPLSQEEYATAKPFTPTEGEGDSTSEVSEESAESEEDTKLMDLTTVKPSVSDVTTSAEEIKVDQEQLDITTTKPAVTEVTTSAAEVSEGISEEEKETATKIPSEEEISFSTSTPIKINDEDKTEEESPAEDKIDITTMATSLEEKLPTEGTIEVDSEASISSTPSAVGESEETSGEDDTHKLESTEESLESEEVTTHKTIEEADQQTTSTPTVDIITEGEEDQHKVMPETSDHKVEETTGITDSPMVIIEDMSAFTTPEPNAQEDIRKETETEEVAPTATEEPSIDEESSTSTTIKPIVEATVVEEMPDMQLPSVIPGEGDCLVGQKTYENNTIVPTSDECEIVCKCVSSIVTCERVKCDIPENVEQCKLDETSTNKCCPSYICDVDGLPPKSEDSIESVEEDEDEETQYTTTAAPHKLPVQPTVEEADTEKSETTSIKPSLASEGVSIPEIEMPVASTEEPMSHVKDEEEFEQQTIKTPIETMAEDKKDIIAEDETPTTPAAVVEDIVVPQSMAPVETSEQEPQEIVTEKAPVETAEKETAPEHPVDQQKSEEELDEHTTFAHGLVESTTDSIAHVPSDEKEESETQTTPAVPSSDEYHTVKPIEEDKKEQPETQTLPTSSTEEEAAVTEDIAEEPAAHTSAPSVPLSEEEKETQTSLPSLSSEDDKETETQTALPSLSSEEDKESSEETEETHTVLPIESHEEIEPSKESETQTAYPMAGDEVHTLAPSVEETSSEKQEEIAGTETTTPAKDTEFPTVSTESAEKEHSAEDSSEDISEFTTAAPIKDLDAETEEEDITRTTAVPSIDDSEEYTTSTTEKPSEEIEDHTISSEVKDHTDAALLDEVASTSTSVPEGQKEDHTDAIPFEDDMSSTALPSVFDKEEVHTIAPPTEDETETVKPTEEEESVEQEFDRTTVASETIDEAPVEYTVAPIVLDEHEETSEESGAQGSTPVVPISESQEDEQPDTQTSITASEEHTFAPSSEESVEEDKEKETQTTAVPTFDDESSIQTTPSGTDIATEKPIDFETKIDTSSSVPSMDEVHTDVPSHDVIEDISATTAASPVDKIDEHKELAEDHTIASSTDVSIEEQTESDEEEITSAPVEKVTESTEEKTTIPSIEDVKGELEPSLAHTVAPSVEGEESVTKSPSASDEYSPEDIEHMTHGPFTSDETTSEVISSEEDMKEDELSVSEAEKEKPTSAIDESTTVAPAVEIEVQSTHTPVKQPSLDLSEEASGESIESEEEIGTEPTKIQHIGEFVTERVEEATSIPTVQSISEEEDKEASGEEGEEIETGTETHEPAVEHEVELFVTTEHAEQPAVDVSTDKLSDEEITSAVTKAPLADEESATKTPISSEDDSVQKTEEDVIPSVTKAPMAELEDVTTQLPAEYDNENVTVEQEEQQDILSVTKAPVSDEHIEHVTAQQPESEEEMELGEHVTTEVSKEEVLTEGVSSEQPGAPDMEYVTKAPIAGDKIESEEDFSTVTKTPMDIEAVTDKQVEEQDILDVTKAPVSDEEIESVTFKLPEEESVSDVTKSPLESEEVEHVTAQESEEQDVEPSVTKAPLAADEIEHVTAQAVDIEDIDSITVKQPELEEDISAFTQASVIPEDIETVTDKLHGEEESESTEDIESPTTKLPTQADEISEVTVSHIPSEDVEHTTASHTEEELAGQDIETSTAEQPADHDILSVTSIEDIDMATTKPSEESSETLDITKVPETLEDTDATTSKFPVHVDEISDVSVTEKPTSDDEKEIEDDADKTEEYTTQVPAVAEQEVHEATTAKLPELAEHITELPTRDIESDLESHDQVTEMPVVTEVSTDKMPELTEQESELPTSVTESEEGESHEEPTEVPMGAEVSTDKVAELPAKDTKSDEESQEVSTELPVSAEKLPELFEHVTELPTKHDVSEEEESQATELPMGGHVSFDELPEHVTELPTKGVESHEATTDLPVFTEESTDKLPEHDVELPTKDTEPEEEDQLHEQGTESPIDAHVSTDKLPEHITELPTKDIETDEESHEQASELPVSGEVVTDKLSEHVTELPMVAEVSTDKLSEHDAELPTEVTESEEEDESHEQASELPIDAHVSTDKLPEHITELPTKDIESDEESHEQATELPVSGEVVTDKLSEHVTELPTKDIESEEESGEHATELPVSAEVVTDKLSEHVTELPTKDIESEEESGEHATELPVSTEDKLPELPTKDTESEEEESLEQATVLPVDVHITTDKFPEYVTELPTKDVESGEEVHEQATEAPVSAEVSTDKLPEHITEIPSKDVESEEESHEEATELPAISPVSTDKLPEIAEHVTELPTKDVESGVEGHEDTTELPLVAHEASTLGQAVEQSTESAPKEEESAEETSTEAAEDISSVKLQPATTVHPLFQHHTTLPSVAIDSRIDDTSSHTTPVPTKEEETYTTPTTTTTVSSSTSEPVTTSAPHYQPQPPIYGQPPQYGPTQYEDEYTDEDEGEVFGPGTCRYGGKLYVSAQQIPRDDPCDFCFCFRSDIICLQQSCPPPIAGCHEEPISGFCCPRYECPVSMATVLNITTSTTTTSTTLPPHFLHHSYGNNVQRNGCLINGRSYRVGEKIESTSGPCINCTCGGDGKMKCDPQACVPEPTMQQVMAVVAAGRKR
ncbi:mucin-17 [Lucilia sericata]|uniref:mucin-17 n=1 Tax=Lucilia sericata TaxID=13632 RepID=UPI0018A7F0BF|nr:mucin-17 [Lucilia sericata]